MEAVTQTFKPLWKANAGFLARDLGNNLMLFTFEDDADLDRVLLYEPWSFDKSLVAFQRAEDEIDPETLVFKHTAFWVQIQNLPLTALKKEIAMAIGQSTKVIMRTSETDEEVGASRIMRIRVQVDISRPLCCGRKIAFPKGGEGWVSFKYERLPNFYYWCGLLTHSETDCDYWLRNQDNLHSDEHEYGVWMCAEMDRPHRKVVITVAGRNRDKKTPLVNEPARRQEAAQRHTEEEPCREDESGDMECEENQGFSFPRPELQNFQHATFEEQLLEIDKEIGFNAENHEKILKEVVNPNLEDLNARSASSHAANKENFPPLAIVTNLPIPPHAQGDSTLGTWKKRARAPKSKSSQAPMNLSEKRNFDGIHEPPEGERSQGKVAHIFQDEFISVVAVTQPRRDQ